MSWIIFLLEEYSLKVLLDALLPRLIPGISFLCVTHEGKQDLERSVPRKLRAWQEPGARFVVVRDNDGADCRVLKASLVALCETGGRPDTLVRIACQEVEAWYLGEPDALASAFSQPKLSALTHRKTHRNPDAVQNPSATLARVIPEFQKVSGARLVAPHLTEERSQSSSFRALLTGVRRFSQELAARAVDGTG